MARTANPGTTASVVAAVALTKRRFVGFDGALAAAGAKAFGVVDVSTDAGQQAPVQLNGVLLVEAGAAIAAKAEIEIDSSGRAITKSAGVGNGFAVDAATGAGDFIRIARGI